MTTDRQRLQHLLMAVAVFALAFSLRLGAINQTVVDHPLRADARDYYNYALNLLHFHTYSRTPAVDGKPPPPDAVRAPGYPAFLAPLADNPPVAQTIWRITFVQALLDSLTVLLALSIYRKFLSRGWALGAAVLMACSPHLIVATTVVLSETLFTFLTVFSLWVLIEAWQRERRILALCAGVLIAGAALTRPTLEFFFIPAAAFLLLFGGPGRSLRLAIPLVLGFILAFTPWLVRNELQIGRLSDPTLTINALHHGMYPDFRYQERPETTGFPYRFDPLSPELDGHEDAVLKEIARRFREEPLRHLRWYLIGKPITLLSWNILNGAGDVFIYPVKASPYLGTGIHQLTRAVMKQLHWPLMFLALLGTLAVWLPPVARRLPGTDRFVVRLLAVLILYFIALHIVAAPFPRYSIPLRPALFGMAMLVCAQLVHYVMMRVQPSRRQAAAGTD